MKYAVKPKKIKVEKSNHKYCQCNNCFNVDYVYKITLNQTDYGTPKGNIAKKPYAKPYEIWLCPDCFKELYQAMKDVPMELDGKPFRWGGIGQKYERTSREWQQGYYPDSYKTCYCCKKDTPLDEPLYCASFKNLDGNFMFKILCRKCAYAYGVGVIESDGKTYQSYEDYLKTIKKA